MSRRNELLASALVALFAVGGFYAVFRAIAVRGGRPPGLVVETPSIHLGKIDGGQYDVRLRLRNTCRLPVRLVRLQVHCDCTSANLPLSPIGPDETVDLSVQWDTRGKRGDSITELAVLYERSTPDAQKTLDITEPIVLRANVLSDINPSPESLTFSAGHPKALRVAIRSDAGRPVKLTSAACDSGELAAEIDKSTAASGVFVTYSPSAQHSLTGHYRLTIATDSKTVPILTIPVTILDDRS